MEGRGSDIEGTLNVSTCPLFDAAALYLKKSPAPYNQVAMESVAGVSVKGQMVNHLGFKGGPRER